MGARPHRPAPGDAPGEIGGLFCVVIEETERVISERRIALLGSFASLLSKTQTPREVFAAVGNCLTRERWDVEAVMDGRAALEAIRRAPPDLVLTDVMMPGLDGFGLLEALRSDVNLRSIPVVLLSARAGEEATAEALKAGADDYIVKPFGARDLLVRVTATSSTCRGSSAAS